MYIIRETVFGPIRTENRLSVTAAALQTWRRSPQSTADTAVLHLITAATLRTLQLGIRSL